MAAANPNITADAIEATEFMDLSRKYRVTGVPKTIVNETIEIMGGLPEEEFVRRGAGAAGRSRATKDTKPLITKTTRLFGECSIDGMQKIHVS